MNIIQSVFAVVIPMFTFPYVSRVLGVYNIGKINYTNSIMSYFLLIANLGVAAYASREVALVRNDKKKASQVASEIFSLNIIATLVAYVLLAVTIIGVDKFESYRLLLIITSLNIITNVASTGWVFGVYEEYSYVAIKSIASQLVTVCGLFLLIQEKEDYLLYVLLLQVISAATCVCDFFYRKKLIRLRPIFKKETFSHFKPIMLMFGINIAGSIYVNSDATLLGYMCGDYEGGLYSAAVKIYNMAKTFLSAMITVITPRLTVYFGQKKEKEFKDLLGKSLHLIIVLVIPMLVGLELLAADVIGVFCGQEYEGAILTLRVLCPSLVFSIIAYLLMSGVMLPDRRDKEIMKISITSAVINVIANIFFIPFYKQNAAAATTVISEIYMLCCILKISSSHIKDISMKKPLIQSIIASIGMGVIVVAYCHFVANIWIRIIGSVVVGSVVYFAVLLLMKNAIVIEILGQVKQLCYKLMNRKGNMD